MAVFTSSQLERLYVQPQSALGTVPNSTGTWDTTGAKLIPHNRISVRRVVEQIRANYKTGTGSMLPGIAGRRSGTFSGEIPLMPSGAAGTAPNAAPLLANIFGVAGTVVNATSVTYNQADGPSVPICLARFNQDGAGHTDQFGFGGIVNTFTINIGGDGYANLGFDGQLFHVLDYDNFANEETTGKGGLTSFPSEPNSPALTGNMVPAFPSALVTIGGSAVAEFVSAQLRGSTGRTLRMDGGKYPTQVVQGRRGISLQSLKLADSDGAALTAVKNAVASQAALDVVIVQGSGAGYIMTHTLKSVQFGNYTFSEGSNGGLDIDFDESIAHASALANKNDYVLALT